jgi:CubicO group peptidase (beta-lactamase class C family)
MRVKALLAAALLCFMTAVTVEAQSLPSVRPEQVGLSSERLQRVMDMLKADVDKRVIPGAVLLVARHGKIAYFETVGVRDPATKVPMTKDSIFRIYSMSKPITSVSAMMLWEDGRFNLSEPVSKYIPQMGGLKVGVEKPDPSGGKPTLELVPTKRDMIIQDLFRHTSGLTYGFFGPGQVKKMYAEAKVWNDYPSNAELVDRLAKLPLAYQPGTTWDYSHSTDVLGRLVEVISRQSLAQFEKERLLDPLGMKDTSFYVTDKIKQSRIAEPFPDDRSIGVDAEFNDPRVAQAAESGGGGMVGTAMDYARFLQMLLNGGTLDGKRILGPKTIAYMTSDHLGPAIEQGPLYLPGAGFGFGLGFAVRKDAGVSAFAGTVGE